MKTTRMIRLTFGLAAASAVVLSGGAALADGPVRMYTNEDLAKLAPKPEQTTNADLAKLKPVPQQGAPIVPMQKAPAAGTSAQAAAPASMQGWDFVFSVLDRERAAEKARFEHELAIAIAAERLRREGDYSGSRAGYGSLFPYGSGFCNGLGCGLGPAIVRTPTNPFQSLEQRGIRTAEDLYRENLSNTRVRRQGLP